MEGNNTETTLCADIDRVYNGLQHLEIPPTATNLVILLDCHNVLRTAKAYVRAAEEAFRRNTQQTAEPTPEEAGEPDVT